MKTKTGYRYYRTELNNYTREFLIEIIEDLLENLDNTKEKKSE